MGQLLMVLEFSHELNPVVLETISINLPMESTSGERLASVFPSTGLCRPSGNIGHHQGGWLDCVLQKSRPESDHLHPPCK